jgi:hypothetical protein
MDFVDEDKDKTLFMLSEGTERCDYSTIVLPYEAQYILSIMWFHQTNRVHILLFISQTFIVLSRVWQFF